MKNVMLCSSVKVYEGITCFRNKLAGFLNKQDGVTAIEYAVIAVAVTGTLMTVFGSSGTLMTAIQDKFNEISTNISGGSGTTPPSS